MNCKQHIRLTFLLLPFAAMISCGQGGEQEQKITANTDSIAVDTLRYTFTQLEEKSPDCAEDGSGCYTIDIDYLQFTSQSHKITDSLNRLVTNYFGGCLLGSSDVKGKDLDQVVRAAMDEFVAFSKEDPVNAEGWYFEGFSDVPFQNKHFISISIGCSGFQGGAHPNSEMKEMTYDLDNLRLLKTSDLFTDLNKVNDIAEEIFRNVNKIPDQTSLMDFGYDGFEDGFELNDNFSVRNNGIYYFFNTYEIGPYVLGPTEMLIRFDQVSDLLTPAFKEKMGF